MLVHEVVHRVQNNLQMIAGLIAMQTRAITDPPARAAMEVIREQVQALGTVHRRLHQSNNVARFDVADFARDLATDLIAGSGHKVRLHLDVESVYVPVEKAPRVELMMNELITNTLKHAFPHEREGRLSLKVAPEGRYMGIWIADDGVGMPAEVMDKRSFGKRLTETLARQLNANIAWSSNNPRAVEFQGLNLRGLDQNSVPNAVIDASAGRLLRIDVQPSPDGNHDLWRARFELDPEDANTIDLSCSLHDADGKPLTETWRYHYIRFASPVR